MLNLRMKKTARCRAWQVMVNVRTDGGWRRHANENTTLVRVFFRCGVNSALKSSLSLTTVNYRCQWHTCTRSRLRRPGTVFVQRLSGVKFKSRESRIECRSVTCAHSVGGPGLSQHFLCQLVGAALCPVTAVFPKIHSHRSYKHLGLSSRHVHCSCLLKLTGRIVTLRRSVLLSRRMISNIEKLFNRKL